MDTALAPLPTRRCLPVLQYFERGSSDGVDISRDVTASLLSMTYADALHGKADTLELQLEDSRALWAGPWFPAAGDRIQAELRLAAPTAAGGTALWTLPCGVFEVDEVSMDGPPSTVTLKAQSAAITAAMRRERRSRQWENVGLDVVAADIAARHGKRASLYVQDVPRYDRLDQAREADLAFLSRLCSEADLYCRVSGGDIVIAEHAELARAPAAPAVLRTDALAWSLQDRAHRTYAACEVRYWSPGGRELLTYTARAGGTGATGETLRIRRRATSIADAELQARAALSRANRAQTKGQVTVPGRPDLVAGVRVSLEGFGVLDGSYVVSEAVHTYSRQGYVTELRFGTEKPLRTRRNGGSNDD